MLQNWTCHHWPLCFKKVLVIIFNHLSSVWTSSTTFSKSGCPVCAEILPVHPLCFGQFHRFFFFFNTGLKSSLPVVCTCGSHLAHLELHRTNCVYPFKTSSLPLPLIGCSFKILLLLLIHFNLSATHFRQSALN